MIALVGFLVVIGAVVGGYLMEHGILQLLFQPAEFLIIGGAAFGIILISTPPNTMKLMVKQIAAFTKSGPTSKDYLDLMLMIQELLNKVRHDGFLTLESHIDNPHDSEIFRKYPSFINRRHAVDFFCDTLRVIMTDAEIQPYDLDSMMEVDMEVHHEEQMKPSRILSSVGDAMPALGIVAAVLGVVLTMQAISGSIEEVGEKVGAALVGTFLGVLLSYGFMQPLSANLASKVESEAQYYVALKQVLLAFRKGLTPVVAVEFARRSIGSDFRPDFNELSELIEAQKTAGKTKV